MRDLLDLQFMLQHLDLVVYNLNVALGYQKDAIVQPIIVLAYWFLLKWKS